MRMIVLEDMESKPEGRKIVRRPKNKCGISGCQVLENQQLVDSNEN